MTHFRYPHSEPSHGAWTRKTGGSRPRYCWTDRSRMAPMSFPAPVSKPDPDGWTRTLVEDWQWTYTLRDTRYRIFVPAGVTYEPSIPTFAEGVIPADRLEPAACPHDVIYKLKGDLKHPEYDVLSLKWQGEWHCKPTASRRYADDLFRLILEELGVASWRTWLAYKAVRYFGQPAWNEIDDFQLPA